MPDDLYTIADLARLADVTPRTIRYYVAQGLLPSPEGAGRATRYSEGHLARLRLIRRLQREHLPLSDIRVRMERMGDGEVQAALDAADEPDVAATPVTGTAATLAYVRGLMTRAGVSPRFYHSTADAQADVASETAMPDAFERTAPDEFPLRNEPGEAPYPPRPAPWTVPPSPALPAASPAQSPRRRISEAAPRSTGGDRSTWERLVITPDVELHVRRPLDRASNKRVDRLARIARELFDDET
jgi:DNA-binding transcriptional MerR regulator